MELVLFIFLLRLTLATASGFLVALFLEAEALDLRVPVLFPPRIFFEASIVIAMVPFLLRGDLPFVAEVFVAEVFGVVSLAGVVSLTGVASVDFLSFLVGVFWVFFGAAFLTNGKV